MSGFKFSQRSLNNMNEVHPDLRKVAERAIELTEIDFGVTEGKRAIDRQFNLVADRKSKTYNSRHMHGMAIDIMAYVNGKGTWETKYYYTISKAFLRAAGELSTPIRWGGDWDMDGKSTDERFLDLVHYELLKSKYPDNPEVVSYVNRLKEERGIA